MGVGDSRRTRTVAVALVGALFVTGCSGGGSDDADATSTTRADASEPSSTTTTADPTPTTTPPGPEVPADAPEIINTGDDFEAMYRSFNEFINWLAANPDPTIEMVDVIYSPRGPAYEIQHDQLEENIAGGYHAADRIQEIVSIEDRGPRDGPAGSVIYDLVVTHRFPPVDFLDRDGAVIRSRREPYETRFLISLLEDEGRWRIGDSVDLI
ncbi:MAG: hypothetical protein R3A49_14170 [Acidimicrobiia bacterium]